MSTKTYDISNYDFFIAQVLRLAQHMYYDFYCINTEIGTTQVLAQGLKIPITSGGAPIHMTFELFETNIDFNVRFMVENNIVGCNWVTAPAGKYAIRSPESCVSRCQIEFDISCKDIVSHSTEGEWERVAPFRLLSFDIECAGRKGYRCFFVANVDIFKVGVWCLM